MVPGQGGSIKLHISKWRERGAKPQWALSQPHRPLHQHPALKAHLLMSPGRHGPYKPHVQEEEEPEENPEQPRGEGGEDQAQSSRETHAVSVCGPSATGGMLGCLCPQILAHDWGAGEGSLTQEEGVKGGSGPTSHPSGGGCSVWVISNHSCAASRLP